MTFSMPTKSKVERLVKENVAAMDAAIAFLRKGGMADTADKLTHIRDYLARSESYHRRIESFVEQAEKRESLKARAERKWLDVTGRKK